MQMTKRWLCTGAIVVAVAAMPAGVGAQSNADIDGGRRLIKNISVECHGEGGAGGDAPSLNRPRLNHAADDAALARVIADGIPNTAMPRIRRFTESELKQLVGYVRSVGRIPRDLVLGDAKNGAAIYKRLACSSCHIVAGEGGTLGPDLSDIGFLRGAAYLHEAVAAPDSSLPKGTLSVLSRGYAEYLPMRIVTRQGREIRG